VVKDKQVKSLLLSLSASRFCITFANNAGFTVAARHFT
jgi:hypothetical protein